MIDHSQGLLTSILGTGFAVAFLHAGLPTHWLPFVLAGRGQGWSRVRTLAVTAGAGLGHVLFTAVLGIVVVWAGIEASETMGRVFPAIAGTALIVAGLYYLARQVRGGRGHHHWQVNSHRSGADRDEAHRVEPGSANSFVTSTGSVRDRRSDWAVMASLVTLLTFSPCEAFLPVYLSGISYGWIGFAALSLVLAAATLSGMVLFTWATLKGFDRMPMDRLERYESGILGALLCLLGAIVIAVEL